jgi:hypothetical protein
MNVLRISSMLFLVFAIGVFSKTPNKQEAVSNDTLANTMEGTIVSVDAEKNMLVLKAKIYREDTLHIDKASVIKAGNKPIKINDLIANSGVKVHYKMNAGKKTASHIFAKPADGFLPDTTKLGENVLVAEGTISMIDQNKTFLTIRAPLEQEYIFSIDPKAEIKSGLQSIPMKDLKPTYSVNIKYWTKDSKKVASSIVHKPQETKTGKSK